VRLHFCIGLSSGAAANLISPSEVSASLSVCNRAPVGIDIGSLIHIGHRRAA
jgi:hypothetical protein